jgi:long-chain acyl-CoA synthetase
MATTPPEPGQKRPIAANRPATLAAYVEGCLASFADRPFLAELGGRPLTYGEAATRIAALRQMLRRAGVRPGDRVALLGQNSTNWALAYLATVTSGAVSVPILNEFHPNAIHNILNMSGARAMFVSECLLERLEGGTFPALERVFLLEDYQEIELKQLPELLRQLRDRVSILRERAEQFLAEHHFQVPGQASAVPQPDDLAAIVYTSGTTGYSKGVMLTQANIVADVLDAVLYVDLTPDDVFLSLLPLAHMYECTCCLLAAMAGGCSVHYLKQKPSPKVLQAAFASVRPTIVFAVPLIIEKIYKKGVLPKLKSRFLLRSAVKLPVLRKVVYRKAVATLLTTFGGRIRFMGFGGAPLSREVERFLRLGGFPYSIGYGMTECAPLITGSRVDGTRLGSCGTPVASLELRIADGDSKTGVGEVQVRGPMVTRGYYQNEDATARAFTSDGWLRTGDLGMQDKDGYLYLKGRSKNVILGPSGENIYPEEIEFLLLQSPFVAECLVTRTEGALTARIYPDYDLLSRDLHLAGLSDRQVSARIDTAFRELLAEVNAQLAEYSRISGFRLLDREFEKTPTEKIKRHLYE